MMGYWEDFKFDIVFAKDKSNKEYETILETRPLWHVPGSGMVWDLVNYPHDQYETS